MVAIETEIFDGKKIIPMLSPIDKMPPLSQDTPGLDITSSY